MNQKRRFTPEFKKLFTLGQNMPPEILFPGDRHSHEVKWLTFRDLIAKAREQRAEIKVDLQETLAEESKQKNELVRRKSSLFRWFYKRRIAELETELPLTQPITYRRYGGGGSNPLVTKIPLKNQPVTAVFFHAHFLSGELMGKNPVSVASVFLTEKSE